MDIELENGVKVTLRKPKVRDRAMRSRIYNALEGSGNDEWEYAKICIYVESVEGIEWQPPDKDAADVDIRANYEDWLELPVELGDWISTAIFGMSALNPKKAD